MFSRDDSDADHIAVIDTRHWVDGLALTIIAALMAFGWLSAGSPFLAGLFSGMALCCAAVALRLASLDYRTSRRLSRPDEHATSFDMRERP